MTKQLFLITAVGLLFQHSAHASPKLLVGKKPPHIRLDGKSGGTVDGAAWDTRNLTGKVSIIFYVAPSKKDVNSKASAAIKAAKFPKNQLQSYAVINMAASSWPNFIISSKIKDSQKEFPTTTYVKDVQRTIVNSWAMADDSSNVLILDKTGLVAFRHDGRLDDGQISKMLAAIRNSLKPAPSATQS